MPFEEDNEIKTIEVGMKTDDEVLSVLEAAQKENNDIITLDARVVYKAKFEKMIRYIVVDASANISETDEDTEFEVKVFGNKANIVAGLEIGCLYRFTNVIVKEEGANMYARVTRGNAANKWFNVVNNEITQLVREGIPIIKHKLIRLSEVTLKTNGDYNVNCNTSLNLMVVFFAI